MYNTFKLSQNIYIYEYRNTNISNFTELRSYPKSILSLKCVEKKGHDKKK